MPNWTLHHGDCLEVLPSIPSGSVDMVCADPPYGTTACKWDTVIPLEPLWRELKRVVKPRGAVVMTASQPFTTDIIISNRSWFRYCWVWDKAQSGSFQNAAYQPLKIHEDVLVFASPGRMNYFPAMRQGKMRKRGGAQRSNRTTTGLRDGFENWSDQYYPVSILSETNERLNKVHPTQKPVALMEYLIRTYTHSGETVLDFSAGSGTTLVAAMNTGRVGIGIEKDAGYHAIARKRLEDAEAKASELLPLQAV